LTYAFDRRHTIARAARAGATTTYGYDGADRISSLVQSLTGGAAVTYTLGYDPAGGLVTRQVSNGAYTFHPGAASTSYTNNGLNQDPTIAGVSSVYDVHGNMTTDASTGTIFGFDGLNRLVSGIPVTRTQFVDSSPRGEHHLRRLLEKTVIAFDAIGRRSQASLVIRPRRTRRGPGSKARGRVGRFSSTRETSRKKAGWRTGDSEQCALAKYGRSPPRSPAYHKLEISVRGRVISVRPHPAADHRSDCRRASGLTMADWRPQRSISSISNQLKSLLCHSHSNRNRNRLGANNASISARL